MTSIPVQQVPGVYHRRVGEVLITALSDGYVEMGYDIFREAKVRRFWAKSPGSKRRPMLLDRLYPYLARSPVAQRPRPSLTSNPR